MKETKGTLEVICGSMFCGKSEELIRRLKRANIARKHVVAFKPSIDNRSSMEYVTSHDGSKIRAIPVQDARFILELITDDIDVIGIDEVQFFSHDIIMSICSLIDQGKRVIVAGLDLDFKRVPFGPMPTLLALADSITKLKAICITCGKDAHFSQRLVNGRPANHDDPIIQVGGQETYQARCRSCHEIDKVPTF